MLYRFEPVIKQVEVKRKENETCVIQTVPPLPASPPSLLTGREPISRLCSYMLFVISFRRSPEKKTNSDGAPKSRNFSHFDTGVAIFGANQVDILPPLFVCMRSRSRNPSRPSSSRRSLAPAWCILFGCLCRDLKLLHLRAMKY